MKTFVSIFIFTFLCAALHAQKKYTLKGLVTQSREYCGGARPDPYQEADLNSSKPYRNYTFYIVRKNSKNKCVFRKKITTDSSGRFSVKLNKGQYYFYQPEKMQQFVPPQNDQFNTYDITCLQKQHERFDAFYNLTKNDNGLPEFSFDIHEYCLWTRPCVQYNGPLPPAAAPRR